LSTLLVFYFKCIIVRTGFVLPPVLQLFGKWVQAVNMVLGAYTITWNFGGNIEDDSIKITSIKADHISRALGKLQNSLNQSNFVK